MATTAENRVRSDAKVLQSYLGGKWQAGTGDGTELVNPTNGDIVASANSKGLDLGTALSYSRNVGGAELRKLTYAQRAELLGKVADALAARRDEWFEIARKNSGNTKADAAIDVARCISIDLHPDLRCSLRVLLHERQPVAAKSHRVGE